MKEYIISPKDNCDKITLKNVKSFFQEGNAFSFLFTDDSVRSLCNIFGISKLMI